MKYYQKPDLSTWAFEEDGSQDHLITQDMTPVLGPPPLTPEQEEQIKRGLLAAAMVKRDILLVHLERLRTRAIEANNTTSRDALSTAITSLENTFNDQRVIDAVDGEVKQVLDTIKNEIGFALGQASPATYYALLALDAL